MIGAGYSALAGEYGLAWQVVSWVLTVAVELAGLLAGLALLNQKFGRGSTHPSSDRSPTASSEEILAHNTNNHEAVEDQQVAPERNGAESENGNTQGIWFPHPDDPSPTETSRTHNDENDEEEADSIPPLHQQPEPESDTFDHIRKLAELRDEGLIDPKEFEAKTRELLDRI